MPDFIPFSDDAFDTFLTNLSRYVAANAAALGVSTATATKLADAAAAWAGNFQAFNAAKTELRGKTIAKKAARAAAEAAARDVNNVAQAHPAITGSHLAAAGLPVHKTTRTAVGDVETHPMLIRVDQEHLRQSLWYADAATPGSRARPANVVMCEIREDLVPPGGPAPTDPEKMAFLAMETRPPHRTDFEGSQAGHTAYYALRWIGKNGHPGPWSPITGQIVT